MSQQEPDVKPSYTSLVLGGFFISLAVFAVAGFILYSSICPCERTPGGFLFGERVETPVADWSFANEVALCQIQVWAGIRPHSINLNCMSTQDGQLYLSCSSCESKTWSAAVGVAGKGSLRLEEMLYPVRLRRVMDSDELDRAWLARIAKLQRQASATNPAPAAGEPRPEDWWSYNVTSITR